MEAYGEGARRVDIGFAVGHALSLRLPEDAYRALRQALEGERGETLYELKTDDAEVALDLRHVVYVRLDTQEQRIGFRGV